MRQEDINSKNLMRLNAFYNDSRYSNKKLMLLVSLRERLSETKQLFKNIFSVGKQGVAKTFLQVKSYFKPSLVEDKKIQYSFEHAEEFEYILKKEYTKHSVAVYTSIFGGYDVLKEPLYISENCDYYAITDQDIPEGSVWKKIDVSKIEGFDTFDNYHKSKYCKMFPHILFTEYEYSVWVDGNVQIVADLIPLVDRLDYNVMATFENPKHDCIYTEATFNICQNNAKMDEINRQVRAYEEEGFPKKFGMRECSIIIRKHSDMELQQMMMQWWEQVNKYTMRDQISLPYVIWKNNKQIDYIKALGVNWRWNPRFILCKHNWHIKFDK